MATGEQNYIIGKHLLAWAFVIVVIILLVWFAWDFLLLAFAGLLLAILLDSFTEWACRHLPVSRGWAFGIVVMSLLAAVVMTGWLFADRVVQQSNELADVIPQSVSQLEASLQRSEWGGAAVSLAKRGVQTLQLQEKATQLVAGLFEFAAGLVVIAAVGFFLALDAGSYREGLLKLVPGEYRDRAAVTADEIRYMLHWWLIGQLIPMVVLGVATYIGLSVLGIPLAFALSLLTAILIFIPYLGALASEIPAVLVALLSGPSKAVEVLGLYLILHIVEAYLLTPLVQRRAARLPPVVTILSQALLWTTAGVLGIALAAPLAAVGMVLVRELYLKESPVSHAELAGAGRGAAD